MIWGPLVSQTAPGIQGTWPGSSSVWHSSLVARLCATLQPSGGSLEGLLERGRSSSAHRLCPRPAHSGGVTPRDSSSSYTFESCGPRGTRREVCVNRWRGRAWEPASPDLLPWSGGHRLRTRAWRPVTARGWGGGPAPSSVTLGGWRRSQSLSFRCDSPWGGVAVQAGNSAGRSGGRALAQGGRAWEACPSCPLGCPQDLLRSVARVRTLLLLGTSTSESVEWLSVI